MSNIRKLKERGRKLPNVLNKKQLLQLFSTIEETDVFVGALLALCCGLRLSEVCDLKKQDVDFGNERIKVVQGKGSKDRYVMLPTKLKPILEKWFRVNDAEYVIPAMYKDKLDGAQLSLKFRKYIVKAGLSIFLATTSTGQPRYAYSFHTLRHTYATFLLEKGVDLYYVQRALGHSDIHTTQIYAYVSQKDLQEKINLAFGRKAEKNKYGSVFDPIQLLQLRYASNELSLEEYKEKLEVLQEYKEKINGFLRRNLLLDLHPQKSRIKPLASGLDFVGYRIFYYHVLLRKRNLRKMEQKLEEMEEFYKDKVISKETIDQTLNGWFGYMNGSNTHNLRQSMLKRVAEW